MEIIAEAGTSHGGSLHLALQLIEEAKNAGADTVKFQAVIAEEIIHPNSGLIPLHGQNRNLYEEFRSLERPPEFYAKLREHTEKVGLKFLCSVFGIRSAQMLKDLGISRLKIASPELNHVPLLQKVAFYNIPIILSTGVSFLADIEQALTICPRDRVTLLHCVTSYPAPYQDYQLHLLPHLSQVFGVPFGVSDHSLDPLIIPLTALFQEAPILEKHLTLNHQGGGLDDPIALNPKQFKTMVKAIREVESLSLSERQRAILERIGLEAFQQALGSGPKVLAPSEQLNYGRSNRSICAKTDLKKGDVLTEANIEIYRVEKHLIPGLAPRYLNSILGKVIQREVKAGNGIVWEDLTVSGTP